MSRLQQLNEAGQGVWLDFVNRGFLEDGGLKKLVDQDGLTGVTSNPSIFEKAMGHSDRYNDSIKSAVASGSKAATDLYETLAVEDIRKAADTLRPVYDRLDARDGYVSLEVSPYLANKTDETIAEARRLWAMVDRPNLMIKVPGTKAGVPAIRTLIEDGINVNVTLLFAVEAYQAVARAFIEGLEARVAKDEPIGRIASVASFFLSRIDTQVDEQLDSVVEAGGDNAERAKKLKGTIAIASAKRAYAWYCEMIAGERWRKLADKGAMPQRLLWASTSTKNPDYSDVLYVETLIGPDTVNTLPPDTMDAFRDHGTVAQTLATEQDEAAAELKELAGLGIDLDAITDDLVTDGVKKFSDAFDALLEAVDEKRKRFADGNRVNEQSQAG